MPKKQKRQKKKNMQKKQQYDFSGKTLKEICDSLFPYREENEELYQQKTGEFLGRKIEAVYEGILSSSARQSPQSVIRLFMRMWDEGYVSEKNIRSAMMAVTSDSFEENMAQSCVMSLTDAFRGSGYSRYFPLMAAIMAPASRNSIRDLAEIMKRIMEKDYDMKEIFGKMSSGMKALLAITSWSCRLIMPESISAVISAGMPYEYFNVIEKVEGKDDGLLNYEELEKEVLRYAGKTKKELKAAAKAGWEKTDSQEAKRTYAFQMTTGQCFRGITPQVFERAYFRTVMNYIVEAEEQSATESEQKIRNGEKMAGTLVAPVAAACLGSPTGPAEKLKRTKASLKKISCSGFEASLASACLAELYLDSAQRIMADALRKAIKEHSYRPEALQERIRVLEQESKSAKNMLKKAEKEASEARRKYTEKETEAEKMRNILAGKAKSEAEERLEKENRELSEKLRRTEKLFDTCREDSKRLKTRNEALEERNRLLEKMLKKSEKEKKRADTDGHYFFAVELEALESRLRVWFPNSLFSSTSEIMSVNEKGLDAIVVMTSAISHGGLAKVEARMGKAETPVVYCNSRNLDLICQEIAEVTEKYN